MKKDTYSVNKKLLKNIAQNISKRRIDEFFKEAQSEIQNLSRGKKQTDTDKEN